MLQKPTNEKNAKKDGNDTVKFCNWKNMEKAPFVIYADFEATSKKYEGGFHMK